jgi:hypothetical protein
MPCIKLLLEVLYHNLLFVNVNYLLLVRMCIILIAGVNETVLVVADFARWLVMAALVSE